MYLLIIIMFLKDAAALYLKYWFRKNKLAHQTDIMNHNKLFIHIK